MANPAIGVRQKLAARRFLCTSFMHMLVVAKVLGVCGIRFVLAIRGRAGPSELERQKQRKEKDEQTGHGARVYTPSMTSNRVVFAHPSRCTTCIASFSVGTIDI